VTAPSVRREDLISRKAAAKSLNVHPNTLDRFAFRTGMTKYRVLGDNQVFYHREDIGSITMIAEVES
jgi:hypothetical protein